MTNLYEQLIEIKATWDGLGGIQEDFAPWGLAGITKASVTSALGTMIEISQQLSEDPVLAPDAIEAYTIQQTLNNLRVYATTHLPSNVSGHMPGFIGLLDQLRIQLRNLAGSSAKASKHSNNRLVQKLAEASSRVADSNQLFDVIKNSAAQAQDAKIEIESAAKEIKKIHQDISERLPTVTTNSDSIEAQHKSIEDKARFVGTLVSEIEDIREAIKNDKSKQDELIQEFQNHRKAVDALLADSNRVGMAASFTTRKQELNWPLRIWTVIFLGSLGGLLFTAWQYLSTISGSNWQDALIRLPISGALIWLGWFSAKQYGYTRRLQEDYAFKVASAMAFEGYKREAVIIDSELLKQLMSTAIANFAENPLRVYDSTKNHATPANELFDKLMKDDTFIGLIKSYVSKPK